MSLYHNKIQWDYNLEAGELVSLPKYSFGEYNFDIIFRIDSFDSKGRANLTVVESINPNISVGKKFLGESLEGYRRVKLSTLKNVTDKAYSPSGTKPSPKEKERKVYCKLS